MHNPRLTPVQCPACGSPDVRQSWPNGLRDRIMNRLGKLPLRCRRCEHRFYRRLQEGEKLGRPDVSEKKEPIL